MLPIGTLVQILNKEEIRGLLDENGRIDYVTFSSTMYKYCDKVFKIAPHSPTTDGRINRYKLTSLEKSYGSFNVYDSRVDDWVWVKGMFRIYQPSESLKQFINDTKFKEELL